MIRTAQLSPMGDYRYTLTRDWSDETFWSQENKGRMLFVMLNPSTADSEVDDPTIRRCVNFARREHYGSIEVVNLYSFRTPKPGVLWKAANPIGTMNRWHTKHALRRADIVVAAWGAVHPSTDERVAQVRSQLGDDVWCLGYTKHGKPRHPLMVAKDTPFERFELRS